MFQVYAISSLILLVKYFVTIMYATNPDDHPEEDAPYITGKAPPDIKRRTRTAMNDLENLPMHLGIFWAAFVVQNYCNASGKGQEETVALTCLIMIYTGFRGLYTLCYVFALQPLRTLSFIASQLAVLATSIILVVAAFKVDMTAIYSAITV
jgi:uncharacterized MAPEG superfamily protein